MAESIGGRSSNPTRQLSRVINTMRFTTSCIFSMGVLK
uniref:Uncharacterized protein n=1 Tax=Anguilla anguilla TaxID=7936 RepID=A0A0E9RD84_ANGAN